MRRTQRPHILAVALLSSAAVSACHKVAPSPQSRPEVDAAAVLPADGTPCGPGCATFETPVAAFLSATRGDPVVLALGEAHAPRGATAPSATKHFTDELLPSLRGRASDLLVELMNPPAGCADATAEVRSRQTPATARQAETNQSEYVVLGERARALGIVPDLLRPSCGDMDAVRDAGDDAVEASLVMIARLSLAQATKLVDRDARTEADRGKAVVVYGGMLHSSLSPLPERAAWAYAPALDAYVKGRLVEVDLIVPEYIGDDASWRALPWVARYDPATMGGKTVLFDNGGRRFVLVFPRSTVARSP